MVESKYISGLYVTVPIYFVVIAVCAFWARREQHALQSAGKTDKLSSHYLGGRSLSPLLTAGTIFASFYSGYTVVGIPNEAYNVNGWMAFRWVAAGFGIITGYFGTGLRLRKAALVRNHKTPVDFITDRFQSQLLRYTVLFLQVVPALIYITAQVVALRSTFNSIFGLDEDSYYPVLIIMTLTLVFEWVGGINCVALTDCLQGSIMLMAYVALPIILAMNFGGWKSLDPATYPRPEFYQTPSKKTQLDFWQFTIQTFTFFTLPHLMQRTYAAGDLFSLKCAYVTLTGGMWFMMMVGVFIGTVGVQILGGEAVPSPFTAVLEKVMDLGGFPKAIGLIAVTAGLAAIMSTADSLLIAISQLVTEEIVYPLRPQASPEDMAWVGRLVSLAAAIVASVMGLTWDKGITDLAAINFQLSFQCVFIFLVGLFASNRTDFHPWCLSIGAWVSSIYVFALYFGYIKPNDDSIPINAGVSGLAIQLVIVFTSEGIRRKFFSTDEFDTEEDQRHLIFPYRPDWDIPNRARFGDRALTPNLLWKMMDGVNEPLTNPWFAALMFFTISFMTPIVAEGMPEIFYLEDIPTVHGLPWWVYKMLISGIIPSGLLMAALYNMPNEFPNKDPSKVSDPDVIELTREELGHRTEYDRQNEIVAKRRRELLESLGMTPTEVENIVLHSSNHGASHDL